MFHADCLLWNVSIFPHFFSIGSARWHCIHLILAGLVIILSYRNRYGEKLPLSFSASKAIAEIYMFRTMSRSCYKLYTDDTIESLRFKKIWNENRAVLDLSGGGGGKTSSGASQAPKLTLTPHGFSQKQSKIHCWPPSGFTTNRLLKQSLVIKRWVSTGLYFNREIEPSDCKLKRILDMTWSYRFW